MTEDKVICDGNKSEAVNDSDKIQKRREKNRVAMAEKRANPEVRATLNARRRELAQRPEAKRKQADRLKDWKSKNSEKVAAYQKQWREENSEHVANYGKAYMTAYVENHAVKSKIWERSIWRNYKLTADDFNEIWTLQKGQCCICKVDMMPRGRRNDSVAVDHNHETGSVRGLLCQACNRAIGLFKDNPDILQSAAKYLEDRGSYGGKYLKGEKNGE